MTGVVTRRQLRGLIESGAAGSLGEIARKPVVAYDDEPLRVVVFRMAETGLTRLPVIERNTETLAGMLSLRDLLLARVRKLNEERERERVLTLRLRLPWGRRPVSNAS